MPTPFPSVPADRAGVMSARLAANWWLIALRGGLAIAFGLATFVTPAAALATFVVLFSAYMIVDGIAAIVAAVRAAERHERWGWLVAEGLVGIGVGVAAALWPASAVLAFVTLLAAWAIVSGGLMIVAALRLHADHGRVLLALAGAVSVLFGILLAAAPASAALALTLWIGAYALVFGGFLVALALRLRSRRARPDVGGGI